MSDEEIVARLWDRNEYALTAASEKYGKYVRRIASNILGSEWDAEEVQNDTWLRLWESIPPNRPDSLPAYIAKTARNLSIDRYKAQHAQKRMASEYAASLEEMFENGIEVAAPEEAADEEEVGKMINEFLSTEKKLFRQVFVSRYFYHESVRDIALRFFMTESKVKSILFRMRNRLRDHLAKGGIHI